MLKIVYEEKKLFLFNLGFMCARHPTTDIMNEAQHPEPGHRAEKRARGQTNLKVCYKCTYIQIKANTCFVSF